ncbi:MAG TPA: RecQ family ATP-dependent DNA helicase [Treponemataceae bacterium]|nr:RecQ family ATP-dependent DNA helicase [Treponemataceae bacterium]HQL05184.1 RecQ family ATP-dependent DNA helicase [Treponemataceae bacterium]
MKQTSQLSIFEQEDISIRFDTQEVCPADEFGLALMSLEDYVERDYVFTENPVQRAAQQVFNIQYLYPWQYLVIANILDAYESVCYMNEHAKDIKEHEGEEILYDEDGNERGKQIVLLPTGAGKSLCFLIPAVILPKPTLILYPLLALMNDQERRMKDGGLNPVVFRGSQTTEQRDENFKRLSQGAKIILANPEVLQSKTLLEKLSRYNIGHIAIDEAHCVSEWGDSFRPAYLTLGNIISTLKVPVVTAFTATASAEVLSRVAQVLFEGRAHILRSESDRPNICYYVERAECKQKAALFCAIREEKPLIVFCSTRKRTEKTAKNFSEYFGKDTVKFYHAGLNKEEKEDVEKWFYPKKDAVLVATCAFGMGVDKKDIKTVIHLDPPPTAEAYIQEAGRGGRDGSTAKAFLIWSSQDAYKAGSYKDGSRAKALYAFAESNTCRRQVLLDALGAEQAFCSGCDICEGTRQNFAEDERIIISFIQHHRKHYSREEACMHLLRLFNKKAEEMYAMRLWESSDIREMIGNLIQRSIIIPAVFPWKGLLMKK